MQKFGKLKVPRIFVQSDIEMLQRFIMNTKKEKNVKNLVNDYF